METINCRNRDRLLQGIKICGSLLICKPNIIGVVLFILYDDLLLWR